MELSKMTAHYRTKVFNSGMSHYCFGKLLYLNGKGIMVGYAGRLNGELIFAVLENVKTRRQPR
ncbi:MAG TPA: hypothetical protein VFW11_05775 [Cyclobacteriaceae bacterium]|nr:hypothetical protein [Cyclobacteriaceae bacterium]